MSLLSELKKAGRDDRIDGVVLRVRRLQIGWGMAQELRDAITDLQADGTPTLAYLDDTGELIASDAYLEVDQLLGRLELIAGYYAENRDAIRRRLAL